MLFSAITIEVGIDSLVFVAGACLLAVSLFVSSGVGRYMAIGGVALMALAFVSVNTPYNPSPNPTPGPSPTPGPTPSPTPSPTPTPTQFEADIKQAFRDDGGTPDDAAILSAMFSQFSDSLLYDGSQQPPRISTANDLGRSFARLQQYRFGSPVTPMGTKFGRVERRASSEMESRGIKAPGTFDQRRRSDAAQLFREVSIGLQ